MSSATDSPFVSGIDPVFSTATPNFARNPVGQGVMEPFRDPRQAFTQLSNRSSAVRNPNGFTRAAATSSGACWGMGAQPTGALASVDVLPGGITLARWAAMTGGERIEALLTFAPSDDLLIESLTIGERVGFPDVREAVKQARIAQGYETSSLLSARTGASGLAAPARASGDAANAANASNAANNPNTNAPGAGATDGFGRTTALLLTAAALAGGYFYGKSKIDEKPAKQLASGKKSGAKH